MKGKKDISKLIPRKIVDKTGKVTTVYVRAGDRRERNFRIWDMERVFDDLFKMYPMIPSVEGEVEEVKPVKGYEKYRIPIEMGYVDFYWNIYQKDDKVIHTVSLRLNGEYRDRTFRFAQYLIKKKETDLFNLVHDPSKTKKFWYTPKYIYPKKKFGEIPMTSELKSPRTRLRQRLIEFWSAEKKAGRHIKVEVI